jgi:zinc transport system substrate-binding protein
MRFSLLATVMLLVSGIPALAQPKVIASVVPVHSIVAAVMGETGQPSLLLEGSMSEHRAKFTPQQIAELGQADLVFIVGQGLEAKLSQLSGSEAVNGKTFVELALAPGVTTLPVREGGPWEAHDHHHGHKHAEDHGHEAAGVLSFDPHVWLDPVNASAMAAAAAQALAKVDPGNADIYAANADAFAKSLDEEQAAINAELAPVRNRPFVVFHDAFQYFEKRFGLTAAGSISDISAQAPSASRLAAVRNKIKGLAAACVFREPQYDGKAVAVVIEGTGAREGVLDPLGASLTPGPGAYQQLLRDLAASLKACLAV